MAAAESPSAFILQVMSIIQVCTGTGEYSEVISADHRTMISKPYTSNVPQGCQKTNAHCSTVLDRHDGTPCSVHNSQTKYCSKQYGERRSWRPYFDEANPSHGFDARSAPPIP